MIGNVWKGGKIIKSSFNEFKNRNFPIKNFELRSALVHCRTLPEHYSPAITKSLADKGTIM